MTAVPSAPELSVVVPSVSGWDDLRGCLRALAPDSQTMPLEVLVVDRLGPELRRQVAAAFPLVRIVAVDPTTPIPRMRALAFQEATSDKVAVIEDHVIVPPGWARALYDALQENEAVGGAVENAATDSLLDWAAFLCEYSHTLPPLPAGDVEWLTGNNVAYSRKLLERHRRVIDSNRWEHALHDAIRREGGSLICRPDIVVGHKKHYTFAEYVSQRYLYSRSYAGGQAVTASILRRLVRGGVSLALPPLLLYRIVSRVLSKRRHRGLLVQVVPLLAVFAMVWSVGEAVGWWFGPGDSLTKVR